LFQRVFSEGNCVSLKHAFAPFQELRRRFNHRRALPLTIELHHEKRDGGLAEQPGRESYGPRAARHLCIMLTRLGARLDGDRILRSFPKPDEPGNIHEDEVVAF
jgi:hypothetical protein